MSHPFLDDLQARGLLHDVTHPDELAALLTRERAVAYVGYDPTATSLHVGNLVPTMLLARLQRAGHRPICLVGGATGMIGDPSGKSDERNLLDADTIAGNLAAQKAQLARLLDFDDADTGARMVNNADWFGGIGFLEFLRDIGKLLTVNYMMNKESVRARLADRDHGISYTEFSYMLLQAYDFVHLAKTHGCRLQMGGSDQWGNITAGAELQRKLGRPPIYGLVAPLLLDSRGQKMGKTSTGERVWLDPALTSPYAMYQYGLNVADDDAGRLLLQFSFRPLAEIEEVTRAHVDAPHRRLAQTALAQDVTTWVHGADAYARAVKASQVMFGGALDDLTDADLSPLLADVPSSELSRDALAAGLGLCELLAQTGLVGSRGAARRLITGGGAYINNVRISDTERVVTTADLGTETMLVLRAGKKSYHIVKVA